MRLRLNYILDENKNPVEVDDVLEWAKWFEGNGNRIVKQEQVGKYWVSTVFLGIDHNYSLTGPPLLFETMVFAKKPEKRLPNELREMMIQANIEAVRNYRQIVEQADHTDPLDGFMERCSTWAQALRQHESVVGQIRKVLNG